MTVTSSNRFAYIDALRGWAILGVILYHSCDWVLPVGHSLRFVTDDGARGVQLFYVVSALTIFFSMASRMTKERAPTRNFFVRRFFRIAPLFYCAVVLYPLLSIQMSSLHTPSDMPWWHIALTLIFQHGWLPQTINEVVPGGWSIAVEMTFYLAAPLLFARVRTVRTSVLLLAVMIVVDWWQTDLIARVWQPYCGEDLAHRFTRLWILSQTAVFCTGIVTYRWITSRKACSRGLALVILGCALVLMATAMRWRFPFGVVQKHELFAIAFGMVTVSLHHHPFSFFVNGFTIAIGKLSYSLYLTHLGVILLLLRVWVWPLPTHGPLECAAAFGAVLTLSTLMSIVTYRLIEKPGIALGNRIVERLESTGALREHPQGR